MKIKTYAFWLAESLFTQLEQANVAPEVIAEIMQGAETLTLKTPKPERAEWMRGAMLRMNKLLDMQTRKSVREGCACCLSGQRLKLMKDVAKRGGSIAERVAGVNDAKLTIGHRASLLEDGRVLVEFAPEGLERYTCSCLGPVDGIVPVTYCYCCGGHVKHHLQVALGQKLEVTVRSSALSSGGKKPCTFLLKVV